MVIIENAYTVEHLPFEAFMWEIWQFFRVCMVNLKHVEGLQLLGEIHIVLNMIEGLRKGYVWNCVRSNP